MKKISKTVTQKLIKKANEAAQKAYSPYSNFKVGAALLTKSGKIYTGCNVENASYSMTICAERNAVFQAVAAGETEFNSILVYVDADKDFSPCGACRQVLAEFSANLTVIIANNKRTYTTSLEELLPDKFSLKDA